LVKVEFRDWGESFVATCAGQALIPLLELRFLAYGAAATVDFLGNFAVTCEFLVIVKALFLLFRAQIGLQERLSRKFDRIRTDIHLILVALIPVQAVRVRLQQILKHPICSSIGLVA